MKTNLVLGGSETESSLAPARFVLEAFLFFASKTKQTCALFSFSFNKSKESTLAASKTANTFKITKKNRRRKRFAEDVGWGQAGLSGDGGGGAGVPIQGEQHQGLHAALP